MSKAKTYASVWDALVNIATVIGRRVHVELEPAWFVRWRNSKPTSEFDLLQRYAYPVPAVQRRSSRVAQPARMPATAW